MGERATLTELWAAIEAIFGAAMRREDAIVMGVVGERLKWKCFDGLGGGESRGVRGLRWSGWS